VGVIRARTFANASILDTGTATVRHPSLCATAASASSDERAGAWLSRGSRSADRGSVALCAASRSAADSATVTDSGTGTAAAVSLDAGSARASKAGPALSGLKPDALPALTVPNADAPPGDADSPLGDADAPPGDAPASRCIPRVIDARAAPLPLPAPMPGSGAAGFLSDTATAAPPPGAGIDSVSLPGSALKPAAGRGPGRMSDLGDLGSAEDAGADDDDDDNDGDEASLRALTPADPPRTPLSQPTPSGPGRTVRWNIASLLRLNSACRILSTPAAFLNWLG
jgi:hypothetical protein